MAFRLTALDLQRCFSSATHDFRGPLPDFHGEWLQANADERQEIFERELHILNDSYKHLGLIGQLFASSFLQTGCHEIRSLDDQQTPIFLGHHFSAGHRNEILYGGWSFDNREKFHDSSNHERTHAIQHAATAIVHAVPYNGHRFHIINPGAGAPVGSSRRLVLTPRAYMLVEELKERGAYTMQKILSDLRGPHFDPQIHLGKALQDYAAHVLESWDVAGSQPPISHLTHYRNLALHNYENMMVRQDGTPYDTDIIYVTVEPRDIAALGNICGLTLFGDKNDDMSRWSATPLSFLHQTWADALCDQVGAGKAVSFRAALNAIGLTPAQYLAASRGPLVKDLNPSPAHIPARIPDVLPPAHDADTVPLTVAAEPKIAP